MTTVTKKVVAPLVTLLCLCAVSATSHAAKTSFGAVASALSHTANGSYRLGLNVGSEPMNLVLTTSSVVNTNTKIVNLQGYPEKSSLQSFQGQIQDEEDSWVRLGMYGDSLSGVISKRGDHYQLSGSLTGLVTLTRMSERSAHNLNSHASQLQQPEFQSNSATGSEISHVVDIAIVIDSQYNELHSGKGLEKALSIINSVDGIYREEFGIALRVVSALNVTDRSNDPFNFGSVLIETMLKGLRDFRMQSTQFNDASLVHLFTGNRNSDAPVGLAWIDTACRNDGYDVGLSTPYRHEILLAAHEIAHNLGAMHDNNTTCSTDVNKIMWPYISHQTSQNFSNCTRKSVRRSLHNSCHLATLDLQVSLLSTEENTFTATIRNNDHEQSSTSSTLTFDLPENSVATALAGDCNTPDDKMKCSIGTLLPGAEEKVKLSVENFDSEANHALVASIDPDDVLDLIRGNNTASIFKTSINTIAEIDAPSDDDQTKPLPVQTQAHTDSSAHYFNGGGSLAPVFVFLGIIPLALNRRKKY